MNKRQQFVIFGATGNLTYKKLIPAIDSLNKKEILPQEMDIICIGRRNYTTKQYINVAKEMVTQAIDWDKLIPKIHYVRMDIGKADEYGHLRMSLLKKGTDVPECIIYYLATAPQLFPIIAEGLWVSGLAEKNNLNHRIVFEKPFGSDLSTAKQYNQLIQSYFNEKQIYRIDHYLGKEMVQNILTMRYANPIFQGGWNNRGIRSVTILAKEKEGVMSRGEYFDHTGTLNDMVQNHLMQMLTLIAMDAPKSFQPDDISDEKVRVMDRITCLDKSHVYLGQYRGYRNEKNIDKESKTETFVFIKAEINLERWRGVPFYFITGKKLDERKSQIIVEFEQSQYAKQQWPNNTVNTNKLFIEIQPKDGIAFQINVKEPGLSQCVKPVKMDYCHMCQVNGNLPEAYEKLLLDIMDGDRTLFTRWDEIEHAWRFIDEVKELTKKQTTRVVEYEDYHDIMEQIKERYGVEF